ncbi:unnamed protein product [Tenebrio molitor]|nr:unnamed protein product [Tenebrio molitor]
MLFLMEKLLLGYSKLLQWGDSRMTNYALMGSPIPVFFILVSYILFIFEIGPHLMQNKQPYTLRKTIMGYNLFQMACNLLGLFVGTYYLPQLSVLCIPLDDPDLTAPHYWYFLLKVVDLFDTVFFVLKKKYKQITFLHMYHHVLMLVGSWMSAKYFPGGQLFVLGYINCFVHLVMYFYYFLTSWDSAYKNNIWWKKNLTQLQIVQHCLVFLSFLMPLLSQNCTYPKVLLMCYLPAVALMIYLFTDFYINAYIKNKKSE